MMSAAILAQQRCQFLCAREQFEPLGGESSSQKNARRRCRRQLGARVGQAAAISRRCASLPALEGDLLTVMTFFLKIPFDFTIMLAAAAAFQAPVCAHANDRPTAG